MTRTITTRRQKTGAAVTGASVIGALVVGPRLMGPSAMAPLAIAASAVGALAIGRLAIADAVIRKLRVAETEAVITRTLEGPPKDATHWTSIASSGTAPAQGSAGRRPGDEWVVSIRSRHSAKPTRPASNQYQRDRAMRTYSWSLRHAIYSRPTPSPPRRPPRRRRFSHRTAGPRTAPALYLSPRCAGKGC